MVAVPRSMLRPGPVLPGTGLRVRAGVPTAERRPRRLSRRSKRVASAAAVGRSLGRFARQPRTICKCSSAMSGGLRASVSSWARISASGLEPSNGRTPENSSYAVTPRAYTSMGGPYGRLSSSSGAR